MKGFLQPERITEVVMRVCLAQLNGRVELASL